jgi:hypothetical protein
MRLDPSLLEQAPQLLVKVRAEQARRSYRSFIEQAWHIVEPGRPLVWGWAMEAIVEHLEALARRDLTRLVICVPPGFAKAA